MLEVAEPEAAAAGPHHEVQVGVELVHVNWLGAVAVPRHQPREDVEVEAGQAREQHHAPVPAAPRV